MIKLRTVVIVISLVAIVLLACTFNHTSTDKYKIGFVTNTSGIENQSFNLSALEGLSKFAKEENLTENKEYKIINSKNEDKFEKNIRKLAKKNFQLIFMTGPNLTNAVSNVSGEFKDTKFAILNSKLNKPNIVSIIFKENEGSFLAGIVAAMKTNTNKIGFIGGTNNDTINRIKYGFLSGVKMADEKIEVISKYANTFNDSNKGKEIAASIYDQGADIIFVSAGTTSTGVFNEAKTRKKEKQDEVWVIGVDQDQYKKGLPENVTLISVVNKVDQAVYDVAKETKADEFQGGKTLIYGINDDWITLEKAKNNVDDKIMSKVTHYKELIQSGSIIVPSTEREYIQFVESH